MKKFAIIDLETTGGTAVRERITEIAIAVHDGEKVLETYSTLVNPERSIPYNITKITGITDEMVRDAPKFYEIAKKVVELTEDCVFVAHNVRFDYSFIQEEFRRLGYTYVRKQLCTVKMARQAMPGFRSYSLGNLIEQLGIQVENRHRALDDTLATVQLFERIIAIEKGVSEIHSRLNLEIKSANLPVGITLDKLNELPEECGVYYLHDQDGSVIYVGKSINIRKRVFEHFADKSLKGKKMYDGVADFSWEVTGSELVSLLLENHEIKRLRPRINRAQKAKNLPYSIYRYIDQSGIIRLGTAKNTHHIRKKMEVVAEFQQLSYSKAALLNASRVYGLCGIYIGVDGGEGPCFSYHLGGCCGICVDQVTPDEYNNRVIDAITSLKITFYENFVLFDRGRSAGEKAFVMVENNKFVGYGYVTDNESFSNIDTLRNSTKKLPEYPETLRLIRMFTDDRKGLNKIIF